VEIDPMGRRDKALLVSTGIRKDPDEIHSPFIPFRIFFVAVLLKQRKKLDLHPLKGPDGETLGKTEEW